MSGRVHKSILNAKVNLLFYFLSLVLVFFSRKVFLDCLGNEFIGLAGTIGNILGYLNLAELGIGSCISFFLYKPLQTNDRIRTEEILSVFGYLYRWIGLIIFVFGIIISLFLPIIFASASLDIRIIYFFYLTFLCSSLIGYFINYRQILLSADQKEYLVAIYFQSARMLKIGMQIFLTLSYHNIYLWISIEFLFEIIGCIFLNWKINRVYPWLKVNKSNGRQLIKKYPEILRNTRQIFIHRIKDFVLRQSDEIFIFAFTTLEMVTMYSNYNIIISKLTLLFNSALNSVGAGIGNLIAEGDKKKILCVFWELTTIRHFIAGFICFCIYNFIEPFICLWLGREYVLNRTILILFTIYIYIANSRNVVDSYNHSYGLYGDVWAAWAELIINICITIAGGLLWGISGILLGKIFSLLFIVVFWKPYYLFNTGLHLPVSIYWNGTIRYYIIFAISFIVASWATTIFPLSPYINFLTWIGYCMSGISVYLLCNISMLYIFAKGTKAFISRLKQM